MLSLSRALLVCAALSLSACATETELMVGDPERVTGGFAVSSSSATGGQCSAPIGGCTDLTDPEQQVTFEEDVLPLLQGPGACSNEGCHIPGGANGGIAIPVDTEGARQALLDFVLDPFGPYVTPCLPQASTMMCNLKVEPIEDHPFIGTGKPCVSGTAGSSMPRLGDSDAPDARAFTAGELNTIARWIECGAE